MKPTLYKALIIVLVCSLIAEWEQQEENCWHQQVTYVKILVPSAESVIAATTTFHMYTTIQKIVCPLGPILSKRLRAPYYLMVQ